MMNATVEFKKIEGFLSDEQKCREYHAHYISATGMLNRMKVEDSLARMCFGDSSFSQLPNAEWRFLCNRDDFLQTFARWLDRAVYLFTQHTNFGYKTIIAHKLDANCWYISILLENVCGCFIEMVQKWLSVRYAIAAKPVIW